ncbi:MAG: hypothetical protein ABSE80_10655 [Halobacteriota archaeon]|jgi:hypothetical protein
MSVALEGAACCLVVHALENICYALLYLDSDRVSNCFAVVKSLMSEFIILIHVRGFYFLFTKRIAGKKPRQPERLDRSTSISGGKRNTHSHGALFIHGPSLCAWTMCFAVTAHGVTDVPI